jgi:hypothetical protein
MEEEIAITQRDVSMNRYPALKLISQFFRLFAWLLFAAIAVFLIYSAYQGEIEAPFIIGAILIGGIFILTLLAISEGIKVLIDIENNTRNNSKK